MRPETGTIVVHEFCYFIDLKRNRLYSYRQALGQCLRFGASLFLSMRVVYFGFNSIFEMLSFSVPVKGDRMQRNLTDKMQYDKCVVIVAGNNWKYRTGKPYFYNR